MDNKSLKSFEELNCWKVCREVRQYIAEIVKKYPNDEKYRLVADMYRAAGPLPIILLKDSEDFIIKRIFNSAEYHGVLSTS